jgi:proteasome lid subunit RPN8/RPN11
MDERHRREIAAHAVAAFPHECCGYVTATAVIRCANASADPPTRYEIGGAELLALVRSFDSPEPALAIYHSHTNGRAYFSGRDAAIAASSAGPVYPVDHVVLGVTPTGIAEGARFAWSAAARAYVETERW